VVAGDGVIATDTFLDSLLRISGGGLACLATGGLRPTSGLPRSLLFVGSCAENPVEESESEPLELLSKSELSTEEELSLDIALVTFFFPD
jgi:hypothetical protein